MAVLDGPSLAGLLGCDPSNSTAVAADWGQRMAEAYLGYEIERSNRTEFYPRFNRHPSYDVFVNADANLSVVDSPGLDYLYLRGRPVLLSGLSVYEDYGAYGGQSPGSFPGSSLLTLGSDYYLDIWEAGVSRNGKVIRIGGTWPGLPGSIKVVYTAGYTDDELKGDLTDAEDYVDGSDIHRGVKLCALKAYAELTAYQQSESEGAGSSGIGPLSSETIDDYSYTMNPATAEKLFGLTIDIPREAMLILGNHRAIGSRMIA